MAEEPTDEQLELVARHGSGSIVRALATVRLAKRQGRENELRQLIEDLGNDENKGARK